MTTAKLRRRLLFSIFPERFEWTNKKSDDTRTCVFSCLKLRKRKKETCKGWGACVCRVNEPPCRLNTKQISQYVENFTSISVFRLLLLTSQLNFLTVFSFFLSLNYTHDVLVSDVSTLVAAIVAWINESLIAFVLDAFFSSLLTRLSLPLFFLLFRWRHTSYDQKSRHWHRRRLSFFSHFVKHPLDSSFSLVCRYQCTLLHTANFHMKNGTATALMLVECTFCERNVERTSVSRDIHPSSIAWYEKLHVTISPSSLSLLSVRDTTQKQQHNNTMNVRLEPFASSMACQWLKLLFNSRNERNIQRM